MKLNMITATVVAVLFSMNVNAAAPVEEASVTSAPAAGLASSGLSLEQRIERLERMLQARNQVQLDLQNQVDDMADSVSTMVGQLEQSNYQIQQMIERQRELYQEMDRRFAQLQTANASSTVNTPEVATA
ncbi:YbgF trimerization domain-containing protein, partial [Agarivorans sp.]|uniref:YbgF trimerization domain-containing protein n=1 Tax=Agarivorans sp. TaxID=1872412 RepID=UPI003D08A1E0